MYVSVLEFRKQKVKFQFVGLFHFFLQRDVPFAEKNLTTGFENMLQKLANPFVLRQKWEPDCQKVIPKFQNLISVIQCKLSGFVIKAVTKRFMSLNAEKPCGDCGFFQPQFNFRFFERIFLQVL